MSRFPSTGVWQASQSGDREGDIIASRNIDLDQGGKLRLARKAMALFSYGASSSQVLGEDPAFQGTVLGVLTDTEYAYVVTSSGTFVMHLTDAYAPTLQAPSSNSPTHGFDSDIEWFQGKPHVSGGEYVSSLNLGFSTWAARVISGLSTTVPHPLCALKSKPLLAVGNGSEVKIYDASYSNTVTIALPSELYATSIRSRGNSIYIGTRHLYGGEAQLIIASGSATAPDSTWGCGADWLYSLSDYLGTMAVITSAGQIRYFNGGGFSELAALPVFHTPYSWASTNSSAFLVGKVTNRGMVASGTKLFINIDGSLSQATGVYPGAYLSGQPSGLWEYTPASGLIHKAGMNFSSRLRLVITDANSSRITTTAHQASTGDAVYVSNTALTGLNAGQVYYAIVESATTMRLALSTADAYAGRSVVIGGVPTQDYIVVDRYETFGADVVSYPGAVFPLGRAMPSAFFGTEVLFGAGLYDSTLTLYRASICSLGMGRNRGSFTTPKITAGASADYFNKIIGFVENLDLDTDEVIVKYRTNLRFGLPTPPAFTGTGATWTSTTTFTVDSTKKDIASIAVGDEIEIISGTGAGYTIHVTLIDDSSSTFVFTVDETMPFSSGTFDFIADNWTKLRTFTSADLTDLRTGFQSALDRVQGKWAQFKTELRGRDVALREMQVLNPPKQ